MERFAKTKMQMNIRNAPGNGNVIEAVEAGSLVQILDTVTNMPWYKVRTASGKTGYMFSNAQYSVAADPKWLADAKRLVKFTEGYLDAPYVFGSKRMDDKDFDCSDLMQWAYYKVLGRRIGSTSRDQLKDGAIVPASQMRTGDLVFFSKNGTDAGIYHVGMYVDKDLLLHTANNHNKILNRHLSPVKANGGNGVGGVTYADFSPGSYWRKELYKVNRPNKG